MTVWTRWFDLFEAEDDVGVVTVFLLALAVTCGKYCQQGHPGWEVEITRHDGGRTSDVRQWSWCTSLGISKTCKRGSSCPDAAPHQESVMVMERNNNEKGRRESGIGTDLVLNRMDLQGCRRVGRGYESCGSVAYMAKLV